MRIRGALLAVSVLLVGTGCASAEEPPTPPSDDVRTTDYEGSGHTPEEVEYAETPPMGGQHDQEPLPCGVYDEPVREENAVHSLEHGAIWVTYDPAQVDAAGVASLESALPGKSIISPYEGLDSPVVATAWNHQLPLDGPDVEGLRDFVDTYLDASTAPEPRVPCDYGVERLEAEDQ